MPCAIFYLIPRASMDTLPMGEALSHPSPYIASTVVGQVDGANIDILLVGDSVAMVVHGHDTTLPITMDEMIVHCK